MPSLASDVPYPTASSTPKSSFDKPSRKSQEKTLSGIFAYTNGGGNERPVSDHKQDPFKAFKTNSLYSLPNGMPNGVPNGATVDGRQRAHSNTESTKSLDSRPVRDPGSDKATPMSADGSIPQPHLEHSVISPTNGVIHASGRPPESRKLQADGERFEPASHEQGSTLAAATAPGLPTSGQPHQGPISPSQKHLPPLDRFSTPPGMSPSAATFTHSDSVAASGLSRLTHRHTLQVPKASTARTSRDFSFSGGPSEEALSATGHFSPTHHEPRHRRASLGLVRRTTRSLQSDTHRDEVPPDEDALRWTEAIRQKRASRRKRKEDEDEDRVVVGTKVDQGHVNWVTAYNMLTGIRFTVSRTNAKIDRELTDADFTARHKFSFDITGNELTPSAKYDFKFKDYSPWVFRHLRAHFGLDPADYLMSLTSKYILSELGSPGKSGSFFYFSRDYKYIIKTIHHAEHKLLRKILREYYKHVVDNPNTLISQFYGLHRVKIPYGRKIHFVIMNNLFPPHRDIHQMFDLKGSTIGRDFKEEELEKNPRATLKDLNWLRRNLGLEIGPAKKNIFLEQMRRDVALLQRLKIMDYSLLVGIHDLGKGNEENLRENTLQVFQPGGERDSEDVNMLVRTASRLENARKARELRLTLKKEKPVLMGKATTKMPDDILDDPRTDHVFYSDDGGIMASHEDGSPGTAIYYLGIIDCLTQYGLVKRVEHIWKSMSAPSTQISPIPPEAYGDRFVNFITAITATEEEARRSQAARQSENGVGPFDMQAKQRHHSVSLDGALRSSRESGERGRSPAVERTMEKAYKQADKTTRPGAHEAAPPVKTVSAVRSPSADRGGGNLGTILPVVEEAGEAASTGAGSGHSDSGMDDEQNSPDREGHRAGGIRRVLTEKREGDELGAPVVPALSASPVCIDREKSILPDSDKVLNPSTRHTA